MKGDKIKIEVDNKNEHTAKFYINGTSVAKADLTEIKANGFRIAIVSF